MGKRLSVSFETQIISEVTHLVIKDTKIQIPNKMCLPTRFVFFEVLGAWKSKLWEFVYVLSIGDFSFLVGHGYESKDSERLVLRVAVFLGPGSPALSPTERNLNKWVLSTESACIRR